MKMPSFKRHCQSTAKFPSLLLLLCCILCRFSGEAAAVGSTPIPSGSLSLQNDILRFSYELEHWLDMSQQPCQNFYAYVCGKSLNSSSNADALLPKHQTNTVAARLRREQAKLESFLASNDEEQLLDVELKLKHFYKSCKEARSLDDLKTSHMYRQSGGWPAIDNSTNMIRKRLNMTWLNVLSVFHEAGIEYFFRQRIEIKSNKRIVHLEPNLEMHYTLRKFEQMAEELLQTYAVEPGRARLVALEIMNFERNKREISKEDDSEADKVKPSIAEMTYGELKQTQFASLRDLDWDAYFKHILGKPLKASDTVILKNKVKLENFFELLENTTMTRLLNWMWIDYLLDKGVDNCQELIKVYFLPVYQHIVERSHANKAAMANMYSELGRVYEELLLPTPWLDEMSQKRSKEFLDYVMHFTLNGDSNLDAKYEQLSITKRNFYRNLEKVHRFLTETATHNQARSIDQAFGIKQAANDYLKIFITLNEMMEKHQNLTMPLNYLLVGERFAEYLIASGSSSDTPGAWRSMDSEQEYAKFKRCIVRQTERQQNASNTNARGSNSSVNFATNNYQLNDLTLRLLAEKLNLNALSTWQSKEVPLMKRLGSLLAAGRAQLTLKKMYFIGTLLTDCRHHGHVSEREELINVYLRNSQEFSKTFGCQNNTALFTPNICKVKLK